MRKWKRYLTGALAAGTAVCMAVYPALAAPEDTAEQAGEEDGLFQVRESPLPVQSYDSGGYRIDVYGAFTQMTGPDGAVTSLEDSRLLYKRGTMLSVSSEFDFYGDRPDQVVVDSVSGEGGTTQYLSVLESDRSLEDYYTQIEWPDELPNSNIVEISSTLDTSEPVLMVRYSDNTVAAFNYVTGSLLFKDDSEKREIGFGEYLEGWFAGTWDSLFGSGNTDYSEVEDLWGEAQTGVFDGFFPSDGSSSQGGDFTGGEFFLTEEGANLENGGQTGTDDGRGGEDGAGGEEPEKELVIQDGMLVLTDAEGTSADETAAEYLPGPGMPAAGEEGEPAQEEGMPAEGGEDSAGGGPREDLPEAPETAGWEPQGEAGQPGGDEILQEAEDGPDAPDAAPESGEDGAGTASESVEDSESAVSGSVEDSAAAASESGGDGAAALPGTETAQPGAAGTEAMQEGKPADGDGIYAEGTGQAEPAGGAPSGVSAAAGGLLTVYDPVTETYEVYETSEYLSSGDAQAMSLSEKKAVMTASGVQTVDPGTARSSAETRGGAAVVAVTAASVGLLLVLLYMGNRKMKNE